MTYLQKPLDLFSDVQGIPEEKEMLSCHHGCAPWWLLSKPFSFQIEGEDESEGRVVGRREGSCGVSAGKSFIYRYPPYKERGDEIYFINALTCRNL